MTTLHPKAHLVSFILAGIVLCLGVTPSAAQDKAKSSSRGCNGAFGRVTTVDGWLLPNATITALRKEGKKILTTQTTTNADGEFTLCLTPGIYDISAYQPGLQTSFRKSIDIGEGRNAVDIIVSRKHSFVMEGEKFPSVENASKKKN
jgi:hypothetical protein